MPGRRLSCRHAGKQANKGKRRPPCALASSLLALGLLLLTRELVGEVLRERLVLLELHGEGGTALGERAQLTDVAEHGRERHRRRDDLQVALVVHVADLPTARVEIANDAAHVLLRRSDLDLHDRLQDHRVAVAGTLLEASAAGDLEGHHGGVHGVEGTSEVHKQGSVFIIINPRISAIIIIGIIIVIIIIIVVVVVVVVIVVVSVIVIVIVVIIIDVIIIIIIIIIVAIIVIIIIFIIVIVVIVNIVIIVVV